MPEIREGGDPINPEVAKAEWEAIRSRIPFLRAQAAMEKARAKALGFAHPERIDGLANTVLSKVSLIIDGFDPGDPMVRTRAYYDLAVQLLNTVEKYLNKISSDAEFRRLEASVSEHDAPAGREAIWQEANRLANEDFKDKPMAFSRIVYYMDKAAEDSKDEKQK